MWRIYALLAPRTFESVVIDELLAACANDDATTAHAATANDGGGDAPVAGHARGALDVEGMWTTGANDRAQWTTLSAQWAAGEDHASGVVVRAYAMDGDADEARVTGSRGRDETRYQERTMYSFQPKTRAGGSTAAGLLQSHLAVMPKYSYSYSYTRFEKN